MRGRGSKARPAFSAHTTLPTRGSLASRTVCARRGMVPRKRPRGAANVQAVFIWSDQGMFGEEDPRSSGNDADANANADGEDLASESDSFDGESSASDDLSADEEPIYGRPWAGADAAAAGSADGDTAESNEEKVVRGAAAGARRLYRAVQSLTKGPDDVDGIRGRTSDEAGDAFRRIVMGIFGSIPGDSFEIVINTERHGMVRLMQSSFATGYALRNAEYRMMLNETLSGSGPTVPFAADRAGQAGRTGPTVGVGRDALAKEPDYMRSVPCRGKIDLSAVAGKVRWWDGERDEKKEMAVEEYVMKLEAENELLKERLQASKLHESNSNRLLDYMRTLSPEKISALQAHISADALEAFKMMIKHVLGEFNPTKVQISYSTGRDYLGQLALWCLLVGYHVRNLEKKFEMTRMLEIAESMASPSQERET